MITSYELDSNNSQITDTEIAEVEAAANIPYAFDDDSPSYSYEQLAKMLKAKKQSEKTQVISIRLTSETLAKAKSLGKGYSGVMSRIITYALDNPEIIKKCL